MNDALLKSFAVVGIVTIIFAAVFCIIVAISLIVEAWQNHKLIKGIENHDTKSVIRYLTYKGIDVNSLMRVLDLYKDYCKEHGDIKITIDWEE